MSRHAARLSMYILAFAFALLLGSAALAAEPIQLSAPINVTPAELQIRNLLAEKTTLEFSKVPLTAVLGYFKDKYHLEVQIDTAAMRDAEIDPSTVAISINVKDVTIRSALNLILVPHNLAWMIKDEVLMVTTKERAASTLETRLYDVRDLVIEETDRSATPDFDSLTDTILATVSPQSWDKAGGPGSVAGFGSNGIVALAVWQNYDGHEQVENLLAKLRALKPQRAVRQ